MIRKLKSGEYRLYSRKKNVKTGKRRNLGTFTTLEKARPTNARCNTSNAINKREEVMVVANPLLKQTRATG
jgi:hypothetical protein